MKHMSEVSFEKVEYRHGTSFSVIDYRNPYFSAPLHLHPEYELILIEEGGGLAFVGDSVRKMQPGDFMLIGRNLPHLWLSSDPYYEPDTQLVSHSVYTQFGTNIFPADMRGIPELDEVFRILDDSQRGLIFYGQECEELKEDFRQLVSATGYMKWMGLYSLLYRLATQSKCFSLTSDYYQNLDLENCDAYVLRSYEYINQNYQKDVSLSKLAAHVGMTESALCRHFKRFTGKTLFEYLTELRISYAAKLLMNRNISINQVAYNCGYRTISHFNRQFKQVIGKTPREYVKSMAKRMATRI